MPDNQNQPKEFDAILGGQAPPPVESAVLGGLQGVKHRLTNPVVEVRIAALSEALNYGEAGLDVAIDALQDTAEQVQRFASRLLRQYGGVKGKQALLNHDPCLFFTTFQDWKIEAFPDFGITDPSGTAYVVNCEQLKLLLQDPQACKVEALICEMWERSYYKVTDEFYAFVETLFDARQHLTQLRALFIGDASAQGYMKSYLGLGDISLILDGYPNLEVLQLRGFCGDLQCSSYHHNLKTLIIETLYLSDTALDQIYDLQLPALEYFELWIGRSDRLDLAPILFDELFPNLSYLGLRSCSYTDGLVSYIAQSPLINRLSVLDLSMGDLTDEGVEALLNCPAIDRLHTVNVAYNCVSASGISQLSQLNCRVVAEPQVEVYDLGCGSARYSVLYE
ncbi:HEAT repeat domain-containing protein [Scytonema tolypothrichoides VB-61278_2]|uniref:HEAT repeat domain-containing protein n=2 Tax=Nostocales TaxID=1161 RepID=A0A8S9SZW9_9CYAN|nr:hypothetical protein [Tolypothrix bouteillei]KAF3884882.1 HEAT repeat domain-containing protein [Tolypothrix bouteillei VB521301]